MSKVLQSFRLDEELVSSVSELRQPQESNTALYSRIISAGVISLQGAAEQPLDAASEPQAADTDSNLRELVDALQEHNATLKEQLQRKDEQLSRALDQNSDLTGALKGAQQLHGISEIKQLGDARATDNQNEAKRPFWARLFG